MYKMISGKEGGGPGRGKGVFGGLEEPDPEPDSLQISLDIHREDDHVAQVEIWKIAEIRTFVPRNHLG